MAKKKKGSARSKKEEQDPEDEFLQSLADSFGSLSLEEMHELLDSIAAKTQNFPFSGWSGNLPKRLDEAREIYASAEIATLSLRPRRPGKPSPFVPSSWKDI